MPTLNVELKPREIRRRADREEQEQLGKNSNLLIDGVIN